MRKKTITILAALFFALSAGSLYAEEEAGAHDDHAEHKNHIGLFLGATTHLGAHSSTVFTAGLDYERRIVPIFGAGILLDFPMDFAHSEYPVIAAIPLSLHPFAGLKITVAPGIEYAHNTVEFLIRGGLGYDIHVGKYTVTPTVSYDYIVSAHPTSALVYGIAIGRGF